MAAPRKRTPPKKAPQPAFVVEAKAQDLTPRQARFVQEYLHHLNGTKAAIAAGYAESGARQEGARLLANAVVARAIDAEMAKNPGVTRQRIVDELAKIAFADPKNFYSWGPDGVTLKDSDDLDDDDMAAVAEVSQTITPAGGTIRVKLSDKQAALDKLMRVVGGYRDKLALTDPDGGPLQINIVKGIAD